MVLSNVEGLAAPAYDQRPSDVLGEVVSEEGYRPEDGKDKDWREEDFGVV